MQERKPGYLSRREFMRIGGITVGAALLWKMWPRSIKTGASKSIPTLSGIEPAATPAPTSTGLPDVQTQTPAPPKLDQTPVKYIETDIIAATYSLPWKDRHPNVYVNEIYKYNILLALAYLDGRVRGKTDIEKADIETPSQYEFTLQPGEIFAFHDLVLPEYSGKVTKTMNTHFSEKEDFKSDTTPDGIPMFGDGVCQLASLMKMVALGANLKVYAPAKHVEGKIPGIPDEYGVSIYTSDEHQNLYITDNLNKPVTFIFKNDGNNLTLSIERIGQELP